MLWMKFCLRNTISKLFAIRQINPFIQLQLLQWGLLWTFHCGRMEIYRHPSTSTCTILVGCYSLFCEIVMLTAVTTFVLILAAQLSAYKCHNDESEKHLLFPVVDSGYSFTHIVPVFNGKVLKKGVKRWGRNLALLLDLPYSFHQTGFLANS